MDYAFLTKALDRLSTSLGNLSWSDAGAAANSAFTTSLLGAAAGAYFGAKAAQRIAANSKTKDDLLAEIRSVNAATQLAMAVCNAFLGLKRQHIKPMKDGFDAARALVSQQIAAQGQPNAPVVTFQADLRTITAPPFQIDQLHSRVVERLNAIGRPVALAYALVQTVHGLTDSLDRRNDRIDQLKRLGTIPPQQLCCIYFGFPGPGGHVDRVWPDLIEGSYQQVDDGIFFSNLLCEDLHAHAQRQLSLYRSTVGGEPPKVLRADFTKARDAGLFPSDAGYTSWIEGFVTSAKPQSRWRRIVAAVWGQRAA